MKSKNARTVSSPGRSVWPYLILNKVGADTPESSAKRSICFRVSGSNAMRTSSAEGMWVLMAASLPVSVTYRQPHTVGNVTYRNRMSIKQTVADNALALIKHRAGGSLPPKETSGVSRLQKAGVPGATAQRVLGRAEGGYTVEALEATAKGLDVLAWQLLVPGLNPAALPTLHPSVASFSPELTDRLRALDAEQLRRVENAVRALLDMAPLARTEGFTVTTDAQTPARKSMLGPAQTATRRRA